MAPLQANGTLPRSVVNVKQIQQASRKLDVIPVDPEAGRYLVGSSSRGGLYYDVTLDPEAPTGQCSCLWAQHGGVNCKHVLAALRVHYAGRGSLSFWRTPSDARRQHRRTLEGENIFVTLRRRG